ncbi:MAG: 2-succinyl-5-enolpyruvyl-6-hydroxy-3-cyclohexene-1-carboxylic-acid synthase [Planctomycetota bacterium]|nr:MAG: 2-succinyl-5-enolpyruvyl-6-hydroxy-3-cyclohexene-1-carboxylic-acid synthase [Planctomycetota bacterium]
MSPPNRWWARLLLRQLISGGLRHLIICPGNRDVPFMAAAIDCSDLQVHSHLDERSAAFRALGLAKATGQPAAVVTTSGSAVANCLPALCEAHASGIPLILISADRPPHLQDCGAPQTMAQAHIFKPFCAASCDLGLPAIDRAPAMLVTLAQALHQALERPGPLHLNQPFDEPLMESQDPPGPAPSPQPPPTREPMENHPLLDRARQALAGARRGLVVCGPHAGVDPQLLAPLIAAGWPILSDACSGLRPHALPGQMSSADFLLAGPAKSWEADLILRLGPAPLARPCWEWLQRSPATILRWDRLPVTADFCHREFINLAMLPSPQLASLLTAAAPVDGDWRERWLKHDDQAQRLLADWRESTEWGECLAACLACQLPGPWAHLALANSLSVRHGNSFVLPGSGWQGVWASRGVNGIDGTIGTAIGLSEALGPLRLLIGDLALLHDAPALAALRQSAACLQIVVLDNGGGRIFDTLPSARIPGIGPLLRSPQQLDFAGLARAFGLPATVITHRELLRQELEKPIHGSEMLVLDFAGADPSGELAALRSRIAGG